MINFQILQLIGEGSFSKVFKARRRQDGKIYALKQMKLSELSQTEQKNCLNEVRMLSRIVHPNIIQYKQAFIDKKSLVLVMQLAEKGDFLNFMIKRRKARQPFSEEEICAYAREMANGLATLHQTNIIHRDIKAANFFISHDGRVKLGDMNVSAIRKNGMAETKIGTPFYNSPEVWLQKPYSTAADMWSFGCLLYQIVTFHHPFTGKDIFQLKQNVLNGNYEPLPQKLSEELKSIIKECLDLNPSSRLEAKDIISNPFIKKKYNQHRQQTMKKDPVSLRTHTMNCARLLRQISLENSHSHTLNLPQSNYSDKKKVQIDGSTSTKKGKHRSDGKKLKPFSQRLMATMQIYNTKRSLVASRGVTLPRARLIR